MASNSLLRPSNISVESVSGTRSRVVLEPLERGFGHTLGNALRRVLLSSIPGAAITEVEIDGVVHRISEGSSFFFDSRLPYGYRNQGTTDAKIFWVNGFHRSQDMAGKAD